MKKHYDFSKSVGKNAINIAAPKVHLATASGSGNRSRCRYSARPSRRVRILPLAEFRQIETRRQCTECATQAATL